jgi:hypothetical protein
MEWAASKAKQGLAMRVLESSWVVVGVCSVGLEAGLVLVRQAMEAVGKHKLPRHTVARTPSVAHTRRSQCNSNHSACPLPQDL